MVNIDLAKFSELVQQGYLTCRPHPYCHLVIWNYTPKTQFERHWTPETMMARGLITTPEGEIIARPFRKFFNLGERETQVPNEPFEVLEKLDGSLGILYRLDNGHWAIATRGSFESEQATEGTKILQSRYPDYPFDPAYTYLFEIVYPENRIIVDYGSRRDIVLLAMIHIETGQELSLCKPIVKDHWPFPVAQHFDGVKDFQKLTENYNGNQEGYVIRFIHSGLRLKIKYDEYVRLHGVMTRTNARTIWELLANNQEAEWNDLLGRVPDEFYQWACKTRSDLIDNASAVYNEVWAFVKAATYIKASTYHATRKRQAELIRLSKYPNICFAMLDHKPYWQAIWNTVRPAADLPFYTRQETAVTV